MQRTYKQKDAPFLPYNSYTCCLGYLCHIYALVLDKSNCKYCFSNDSVAIYKKIFCTIDGGLKKVPCTIQYCLVTCSLSIFLLMFCDYICKFMPNSLFVKSFTGAGKNPLMSYIAFDSFIMPLMKLTGFIYLYKMAYPPGMTGWGIVRAATIVFFTIWCVSLLSKKRIFWKA